MEEQDKPKFKEAMKANYDKKDRKKRLKKYQSVLSNMGDKPKNVGEGIGNAMKTVASVIAKKKENKK
jgi:hypothetical protein